MTSSKVFSVLTILFIIKFSNSVSSQKINEKSLSTSISDMVYLLDIEMKLIESVEKYITKLEHKVNTLKNLVQELRKESEKYLNKREEYLHNPLNGFTLIRRLYSDWPQIKNFMTQSIEAAHVNIFNKYRHEMPTTNDLREASDAINRLQIVYNLKVEDLEQGIINGKQYDSRLKSIDSFSMGCHLFKKELYYSASVWLNSSIMNYKEQNYYSEIIGFEKEKILELYAETLEKLKHPKDAFSYITEPLGIEIWDDYLRNRNMEETYRNEDELMQQPELSDSEYEFGCRGDFNDKISKLYCIYNTTTTPFLRLAPIKMEILNLEPYMVLFHDVITENEIDYLINLAKPNLKRAGVYNIKNSDSSIDDERTSKAFWLNNVTDKILDRIDQRIIDMSGFDIIDSESLQISNYGIAGHFGEHYDFFNATADNVVVATRGDRLATVLFYLTNVEQGGATVFPKIKTAIFPHKGSAIMWYNLNNKLEADYLTSHAACPVLVGSKWICTKWIRAEAQTFKRPCYK